MIRINRNENPLFRLSDNLKIVRVDLIGKEENNKVWIELNGQKILARLDTDIPHHFLAVVQMEKDQFHLRVLESFKNTTEYQHFIQQQYLDQIQNFLVSSDLPLSGDFVEDALFLIKYGIPLNKKNLKLIHLSKLKFGNSFSLFVISLIQHGVSLSEEDLEQLYYSDQIMEKWLQKEEGESDPKEKKNEDLIRMMEELLSIGSEKKIRYFSIFTQNDQEKKKSLRKYSHQKKEWTFDLSPQPEKTAWLQITQEEKGFSGVLILDSFLYPKLKENLQHLNQNIRSKIKGFWKLKIEEKIETKPYLFCDKLKEIKPVTGINIFV